MPAGRPSTYDPKYCEMVIDLGKQGKSEVQISAGIDVPRTTMRSWAEQHPEFSSALTRAKELEQAWWEDAAQKGTAQSKIGPAVWNKSVSARFREDYTERHEVSGSVTVEIVRFSDAKNPPAE